MPEKKKIKTIIDTNLFISFLIGKRLIRLKQALINSRIVLIFSEQNTEELLIVPSREKFRKYFTLTDVYDLIDFIQIIGQVYQIEHTLRICRDPKDDYLLALAKQSKAEYLVTGNSELLDLKEYGKTKIISINCYEKILEIHSKA